MRSIIVVVLASLLVACGGGPQERTTPDERGDLVGGGGVIGHQTLGIPPGIDGSRWRWTEAYCTEGPLDLLARGYAATVEVHQDGDSLTLVTDQVFATESCQHTLVQHAAPGVPDWQIEEVTRIAVPSTPECFGSPEARRPGDLRITDGRLEVLIQRSQWCNGLEVRMVYERAPEELLSEDQIIRRYAAFWSRGDAAALSALFATGGSLLEPFTQTQTGDAYRHVGREAVLAWFEETFETAPWRSLRITEITEDPSADGASHRTVTWEYMDPRLSEPFSGTTRFTIAAGEIFEARIELTSEPAEVAGDQEEASEGG
ncbi:MAG TPA: nuclear transport factor 2 family protein [Polyangiaceae bacterium]|nr:nuclear transport factor 2 family protein [Polyangiaceae bacterium]